MFNKVLKNVSKEDLAISLNTSIVYNEDALDYIINRKNLVSNMLKYNETDEILHNELNTLKYIELTLKHVGALYEENLSRLK